MRVLPLHQLSELASSDLGQVVHYFKPILNAGLPLIPGIVLPITALRAIATHNQLESKLQGLLQAAVSIDTVADYFTTLTFPPEISQQLLHHYHTLLADWPVAIKASWLTTPSELPSPPPVRGDASTFHTLLDYWGRITWHTAQRTSLEPWAQAALMLVPLPTSPIVITVESKSGSGQPTMHISILDRASKQQSTIEVDSRSYQIVNRGEHSLASQIIDDNLIMRLAELVYRAKQQTLDHLRCSWQLHDNQWVITECNPLSSFDPTPATDQLHQPHLLGRTSVSGYVTGVATLVKPGNPLPRQWPQPTILVTHTLDKLDFDQLKNLVGVVCEQGTSAQAHRLLTQYGIPTLIQVRGALSQLTPLQPITLDGRSGTIFYRQRAKAPLTSPESPRLPVVAWLQKDTLPNVSQTDQCVSPSGFVVPVALIQNELVSQQQELRPLLQTAHSWLALNWSITQQTSELTHTTELVNRISRTSPHHPHLVLPAVHTLQEAERVINRIKLTQSDTPLRHWWLVSTPENIIHSTEYLDHLKPRGVIIDIGEVATKLTGISWSEPGLAAQYPMPITLLQEFLQPVHEVCRARQLPIFWKIPHPTTNLLQAGTKLQIAGLMVAPYDVGETYLQLTQLENLSALWQ